MGPDHPETNTYIKHLAILYYDEGLHRKAEPLARRALTNENMLIQREAPFLPRSDRQAFVGSFGGAYEIAFSSATRGPSGANLALFSRLNRQGLLEEIEKRQHKIARANGYRLESHDMVLYGVCKDCG